MSQSFHNGKVVLHAGDCMEVLRELPDNSIDSVVTDPPYHLTSIVKRFGSENAAPAKGNAAFIRASRGFMGKVWDGGDIAFTPELWAEVLRVLKPGGHMAAFSGTRTYHRMACAIEDAGFEIRDQLAWTYGSGFPKSHDVSKGIDRAAGIDREDKFEGSFERRAGPTGNRKCEVCGKWLVSGSPCRCPRPQDAPQSADARQWQGWGTALKPAWEPICLARKPLSEGTVAANVLRWGTGAINVDGCRIGDNAGWAYPNGRGGQGWHGRESLSSNVDKPIVAQQGRFPANLIHDGSPEVLAGFPDRDGATSNSGVGLGYGGGNRERIIEPGYADSGSAARFFACFPIESNACTRSNANYAEPNFSLSSEPVVSVLSRVVAASTPRLALQPQSYRAPDTNVSARLLDEAETLLIAAIQSIERRFWRGLQPERHTLSGSLVSIAAIPKPTGIITITISLSKLSGFVGAAMFNLIEMNGEAGESVSASRFYYTSKADAEDRIGSKHPTVKPVDLMQWLARLICPKGGTVLDPFAGTGTTGAAAFIEGCRAVLIEREAEYLADIERRMELLLSGPDERARKLAKPEPHESLPLFGVA